MRLAIEVELLHTEKQDIGILPAVGHIFGLGKSSFEQNFQAKFKMGQIEKGNQGMVTDSGHLIQNKIRISQFLKSLRKVICWARK